MIYKNIRFDKSIRRDRFSFTGITDVRKTFGHRDGTEESTTSNYSILKHNTENWQMTRDV